MKRRLLFLLTLSVTLTAQETSEAERDGEQRDGDQLEPWTVGMALPGDGGLNYPTHLV